MRSSVPVITKSDYLAGLGCLKRLYLAKYHSELGATPNEADMARMKDGSDVGKLARLWYPDGILIEGRGDAAVQETARHLPTAFALFEAQVQHGGRVARFDILKRTPKFNWGISEVKSSTKVREEHIHDVAFQISVARDAGLKIESAELILVDNGYVHNGGIPELGRFFSRHDVSKDVEDVLPEVRARTGALQEALTSESAPQVETNRHCQGCAFYDYCHEGAPKHDVVTLYRISERQVSTLRSKGFATIDQIPETPDPAIFKFSLVQRRMRDVVIDQKPYIDDLLRAKLESLRFPIAFIDFEAASYTIPHLSGTKPYEQLPFQWSCHVLRRPDSPVEHHEFLHDQDSDPRPAFAGSLLEHVRSAASVVVYSSFEWNILRKLHERDVPFAEALQSMFHEKNLDLLKLVQETVYFEDFLGSFSIKSVLPAVVKGLSYEDLRIRDGNVAAIQYKRMVAPGLGDAERRQIRDDLLAYCGRDTLAMVELYREMVRLSGAKPKAPVMAVKPLKIGDQLALNI